MAKKSGLGKGLESLMSGADAETGMQSNQIELPLTKIKVNKNQPRSYFDEDELANLTSSIQEHGVLQPILVRKMGSTYEIIAGERRFQAAKRAKLKKIPACIKEATDEDVFKFALIENIQRSDLNPIEEARGYQKLLEELHVTQDALGKIVSKSRSTITNSLRLLDLSPDVQEFMIKGLITAGHARAILSIQDKDAQVKLANKVIAEHLSVRETENLATLILGASTERKPRPITPQSYKRAAKKLRSILHSKVRVKTVGDKNKIEIEFEDDQALARIVQALETSYRDENDI